MPFPLIYLVDDQEDNRRTMKTVFSHCFPHYPVSYFSSGPDLLDTLMTVPHVPNLVLLDFSMPVMNGLETLQQVRKQPSCLALTVVMFSTFMSPEESRQCYLAGANDVIEKPFDYSLLCTTTRQLVQNWTSLL